jgi:hypothetical protein
VGFVANDPGVSFALVVVDAEIDGVAFAKDGEEDGRGGVFASCTALRRTADEKGAPLTAVIWSIGPKPAAKAGLV